MATKPGVDVQANRSSEVHQSDQFETIIIGTIRCPVVPSDGVGSKAVHHEKSSSMPGIKKTGDNVGVEQQRELSTHVHEWLAGRDLIFAGRYDDSPPFSYGVSAAASSSASASASYSLKDMNCISSEKECRIAMLDYPLDSYGVSTSTAASDGQKHTANSGVQGRKPTSWDNINGYIQMMLAGVEQDSKSQDMMLDGRYEYGDSSAASSSASYGLEDMNCISSEKECRIAMPDYQLDSCGVSTSTAASDGQKHTHNSGVQGRKPTFWAMFNGYIGRKAAYPDEVERLLFKESLALKLIAAFGGGIAAFSQYQYVAGGGGDALKELMPLLLKLLAGGFMSYLIGDAAKTKLPAIAVSAMTASLALSCACYFIVVLDFVGSGWPSWLVYLGIVILVFNVSLVLYEMFTKGVSNKETK